MRSENTDDTPIISGTLSLFEDYFGASELRQGLYMPAGKYLPLGMDIQSVFNCACHLALGMKDAVWEQRH